MESRAEFCKMQGAGNDFVVLDNRDGGFSGLTASKIAELCDRRFGVGADGLLLLSKSDEYQFRMEYFNQDGSRASFCGNGARCICLFAVSVGAATANSDFTFIADDGEHKAHVYLSDGRVDLTMKNVDSVTCLPDGAFVLNTGVPHYVRFVDDVDAVNLMNDAPSIRYSDAFRPDGVNVNFVSIDSPGHIRIRTYERGVEGETLACGTGITAAAISSYCKAGYDKVAVSARGGDLNVSFCARADGSYSDVLLSGPATIVFEGRINL